MLQERLVGLATLSIEHEIARDIELMELFSTFAKAKAAKNKVLKLHNIPLTCIDSIERKYELKQTAAQHSFVKVNIN